MSVSGFQGIVMVLILTEKAAKGLTAVPVVGRIATTELCHLFDPKMKAVVLPGTLYNLNTSWPMFVQGGMAVDLIWPNADTLWKYILYLEYFAL
mmetsp:Transcript_13876/g.33048  ORF Transcript_13876/g.33048 Transcript_13876/m.33048 type:complete len:94 (-) Transcript_13876:491-772(-)